MRALPDPFIADPTREARGLRNGFAFVLVMYLGVAFIGAGMWLALASADRQFARSDLGAQEQFDAAPRSAGGAQLEASR